MGCKIHVFDSCGNKTIIPTITLPCFYKNQEYRSIEKVQSFILELKTKRLSGFACACPDAKITLTKNCKCVSNLQLKELEISFFEKIINTLILNNEFGHIEIH